MFCMNCGKEIPDGAKFCANCGGQVGVVPKSEAPAANMNVEAQPVQEEPVQPVQMPAPVPPVQQTTVQPVQQAQAPKNGITISKPVLGAIAGVIMVAAIIAIVLGTRGSVKYNDPDLAPVTQTATAGYEAYASDSLDISFLYPASAQVRENGNSGIYVYTGGNQGIPYIQIETQKGSVKTDSYFKDYKKSLTKDNKDAQIGNINQVNIVGKTLYMMRAELFVDGADQVIDRYIEQYKDKTIIYTIKSYTAGSEDQSLKAVVESLRTSANAYAAIAGGQTVWGGDTSVTGTDTTGSGGDTTTGGIGDDIGLDEEELPEDIGDEIEGGIGDVLGGDDTESTGDTGDQGGIGGHGQGDWGEFYSPDYTWGFMADKSLISNSSNDGTGVRIYPIGKTDKNASIFVQKNNFSSDGITNAQDFITAYGQQLQQGGAAQIQNGNMQGANFIFYGVLGANQDATYGTTVWACNDNQGNIYSIYYECSDVDWAMYTEIAQAIMYSFMVAQQ